MIKGILLDFDGTIANTGELILSSFAYAVKTCLGREAKREEMLATFGLVIHDAFFQFTQDENKITEMAQWQAIAEGTSSNGSGERVQTSASLHKMEDAVVRIVDIESEIEKLIHKYISYKQEVIETLEQLETTSYDILPA